MNALHLAAFGGHLETVKYLMPKFGDSRFDLDTAARSCLHYSVEGGHPKVVRYLIEEGAFDPSLRDKVRDIFCTCMPCASMMSTCYLIQHGLDCFLLACNRGKLKVLQELVNRHTMDPHVVNEVCVCIRRCI